MKLRGLLIMAALLFGEISVAQPVREQMFDTTTIPASQLGAKIWTIVSQSVINIRREPAYAAEMTTQALLGTPLKILAKRRGWHQILTPEGYVGWTSSPLIVFDSVTLQHMNLRQRVIVLVNNAIVYKAPRPEEVISEVVMGNILYLQTGKKRKGYYEVAFPDGRAGFIKASQVQKWNDWKNSIRLTGSSLEQTAKQFTGLPYFWGGTSSRGMDCSGLTKTTFLMHGIILPRDARQQYLTGMTVDSVNNFSLLQKGDLLFFGRKDREDSTQYRIIHTGLYLQDRQFIQAGDGCVQISSLDPGDSNYDGHNRNRYVIAKRLLGQPHNGTWSIFEHPWYR